MNSKINVKLGPAIQRALLCLSLLLTLPATVKAQTLYFTTNADGASVSITNCSPFPSFPIPIINGITLPTNFNNLPVTGIASNAFAVSGVGYISIPLTITNITPGAFASCANLNQFNVDSNNPSYSSTNGALLDKNQTTLIQYPCALPKNFGTFPRTFIPPQAVIPPSVIVIEPEALYKTGFGSVEIPASVRIIGDNCFAACPYLTNAVIFDGVTNIGSGTFSNTPLSTIDIPASVALLGTNALADCTALALIDVDSNNLFYSSVDGVLMDKAQSTLLQCPSSFAGDFAVPTNVKNIPAWMFASCYHLSGITIPNGVTNIGVNAFNLCQNLASATIPNSVINIGSGAFSNCRNLANVSISTNLMTLGAMAFSQCAIGNITIPGSVTTISEEAFGGCDSLTNAVLLNGITAIGKLAFFASGLTTVAIPASVTSIGTNAFGLCLGLTAISVDAANSTYSSANGMLFDKNQTTLLRCPGGLSFAETLPSSVTAIGDYAYAYCRSLTSLTIPEGITNIGQYGLAYCSYLSNVTISASVLNIEQYAFQADYQLSGVFFRGNAPAIDSTAYSSATGTNYYLPGTTEWTSPFAGLPAILWNPTMQTAEGSFGVQSNQFGFNITGSSRIPVVVERSTNLESQVWIPIITNTLASSPFFFSEPLLTNGAPAFYRITTP